MSMLRNLEAKLEGLVEGAFSRAFKSKVQPVELARKLAKEMDENKQLSISRVYVPNHYTVWLSAKDREQFANYETALQKELSDYLLEHARDEGLALVTRPQVEFETDERLRVGEFGIQTRLLEEPDEEEAAAGREPGQGEFGETMVYSADREAEPLAEHGRHGKALLAGAGKRIVLSDGLTIGRSHDCDLVLDDPNVSRRHAQVRQHGAAWLVVDLGSTNGIKVNGRRVSEAPLEPGDEITLGLAKLTFERE